MPAGSGSEQVTVRRALPSDEQGILALRRATLGHVPEEHLADFFAWKHRHNPFGTSPTWVAVDSGRIVGLRTFLRWEFDRPGGVVAAVRAVDTATHPEYQGRGIFTRLTLHALEELRGSGVGFVFNTPNDRSRPGYLKMGWQVVGRVPLRARPGSLASVPRILRARQPAEPWSLPTDVGVAASDALADTIGVERLLAEQSPPARRLQSPPARRFRTRRTVAYLRWRYGFDPLGYRAIMADAGVAGGVMLFRLRRRGPAVEATVCDVIVPDGRGRVAAELARRVMYDTDADYALRAGGGAPWDGYWPLPQQGPVLTWRAVDLSTCPPRRAWDVSLGDVELL